MNLEPQKFFIGLMDFFSILLPGALLTYLLMDQVGPVVLGQRYAAQSDAEGWAAFLIASYLLGHFVFLVGAWFDKLYDPLRRRTSSWQVTQFAKRGRLLNWPTRLCVALMFGGENDVALKQVLKVKQRVLGPLQAEKAVNAFQWCKVVLGIESPQGLAVVQRFEADSKFFRSFAVLLLVVLATWPLQQRWSPVGIPIMIALFLLTLWRYMEQRHKATNNAYWFVLTLTANDGKVTLEKPAPEAGGLTHAGGVVYRIRRKKTEYLLVEAKKDPTQWVLPKGHVEGGERHREAAVREVHEETGVLARVIEELRDVSFAVDGDMVHVRYFLMQGVRRGRPSEKDRRHMWLGLDEAVEQASHHESRELLKLAEQRRPRTAKAKRSDH